MKDTKRQAFSGHLACNSLEKGPGLVVSGLCTLHVAVRVSALGYLLSFSLESGERQGERREGWTGNPRRHERQWIIGVHRVTSCLAPRSDVRVPT